jgi:dolichyl-phosphate-mannose--protein O-mannosyl transferase
LWWSWPFLARPIWFYSNTAVQGLVANIYAMGNPLFFWGGIVSFVISGLFSFFEKNKKVGFILFSYLFFFVPWAFSPRIMFLYHYLPSIPFLAIIIGWVLRRYQKLIPVFFTIAFVLFIYFFPHLVGIRVPLWLDRSYYWFTSWK